jgi:hypothetical protein
LFEIYNLVSLLFQSVLFEVFYQTRGILRALTPGCTMTPYAKV